MLEDLSENRNAYRSLLYPGDPALFTPEMQAAALDRAYELRTTEIELIWKRGTYFFTTQAAIFAALGLSFRPEARQFLPVILLLAILGLLISHFGHLADAIGSRYGSTISTCSSAKSKATSTRYSSPSAAAGSIRYREARSG
ncbi:hypothetical protein P6144_09185 [Sphingomonas sp. HITSZ_GF]|uniref:RipA family octameric membrane protein n=1 Tax=Sphingomonas sp. HITSZ_GF TaxID=3037247 RepID=UPI00240DB29B|nr:hypothetical protein [Sphingomonas sp. HITSZ_GF]MDG2533818.1 hypothetical protein [Sphingomonas sp. HITSZ_GF]